MGNKLTIKINRLIGIFSKKNVIEIHNLNILKGQGN